MSPEMFQRWRELVDILRLAVKDYRHEWVMSGCLVFALAAVLAPLMVLFGLKYGIIASMFEPLVQDPRNREVRPMGSGRFGPKWFETMRARPDVAFLIPHTRTIAATLKLHVPDADAGRIIDVELIPSATGDPVLDPEVPAPTGYDRVVLSTSAATKLGVHARHRLEASVSRTHRGRLQRETLPLTVAAVAKPGAFNRDGLFVSLELLVAVEDFRDGRRVPALGWQGDDPADEPRVYSGYRLYARSIEDVAALRTYLIEQGLEVRTKAADIELVQALDRNLSIVYWIIVLVALVGYGLSLGASLWANVDRKRREFSVLRLVGFSTHGIVWFPVAQALLTGLLGVLLASVIYRTVEVTVNAMFASNLALGQSVCVLLPLHYCVTMLLTLIAAASAAALSGIRVARIEPSEGLREI